MVLGVAVWLTDVHDALISRRVCKAPMPHEQAAQVNRQGRGQHFDPDIADASVALQDSFMDIAARFADRDQGLPARQTKMGLPLASPSGPL